MEFQTMGRKPLSRFMLGVAFLIKMAFPIGMASTIFLPESFISSLDCGAFPVDVLFSRCTMPFLVCPCHQLCIYSLLTFLYISVWVGF